jgi:hypothetical protein
MIAPRDLSNLLGFSPRFRRFFSFLLCLCVRAHAPACFLFLSLLLAPAAPPAETHRACETQRRGWGPWKSSSHRRLEAEGSKGESEERKEAKLAVLKPLTDTAARKLPSHTVHSTHPHPIHHLGASSYCQMWRGSSLHTLPAAFGACPLQCSASPPTRRLKRNPS